MRILKADCTQRPHFQYLLFQLVERHLVFCQDLFASNLFSSWIVLLKLLRTQWLRSFRGRSCLLPMDMDAPESTIVNHCGKFVMFLVHISLPLFSFAVCPISRSKCLRSCGTSCFEIASRLICLPCFSLNQDCKRRTDVLVRF